VGLRGRVGQGNAADCIERRLEVSVLCVSQSVVRLF
jgi:hypothetical protein